MKFLLWSWFSLVNWIPTNITPSKLCVISITRANTQFIKPTAHQRNMVKETREKQLSNQTKTLQAGKRVLFILLTRLVTLTTSHTEAGETQERSKKQSGKGSSHSAMLELDTSNTSLQPSLIFLICSVGTTSHWMDFRAFGSLGRFSHRSHRFGS